MEESILKSTKEMVDLVPDDTSFDTAILTHINSALSTLYQLGIGDAIPIADDSAQWADLGLSAPVLNMVKTLVFLKVKIAFDPPATSFHIEAVNKQISEQEWRLSEFVNIDFSA